MSIRLNSQQRDSSEAFGCDETSRLMDESTEKDDDCQTSQPLVSHRGALSNLYI
jgi:hypothetical protein